VSVADKDGRIAQMVYDRLACVSMSIHEHLRESSAALHDLLDNLGPEDDENAAQPSEED
jgi:hypothetical protein